MVCFLLGCGTLVGMAEVNHANKSEKLRQFCRWQGAHAYLEIAQKSTSWTALLGGLSHLPVGMSTNIQRQLTYPGNMLTKWVTSGLQVG